MSWIILFSSDENFVVLDYCPRNMVQVSQLESVDGIPGLKGVTDSCFLLWVTLLQNHENKTQEMLLSFSSESDRGRWVEAVTPATSQVALLSTYQHVNMGANGNNIKPLSCPFLGSR